VTEGLDQPDISEGPQGGSAALSARSISRAEGVDAFQALQRVLYRSAKQDPQRRFHALYDKLTRRDVMWRAWVDVATNQGSPGVDGVSIASIEDGGVEAIRAFLDELAAELEAETYRPRPLRRVNIPKPGQPGKSQTAFDPLCSGSGDHGSGQVHPGTDLRGAVPALQFRVPTEAVGAPGSGSGAHHCQPGGGLGARR
jgi:hypothetical protein